MTQTVGVAKLMEQDIVEEAVGFDFLCVDYNPRMHDSLEGIYDCVGLSELGRV
jgi:hypothetical protein